MNTQADNRIPVTVLTGFLGSGKTTLLNRILSQHHGHRIAVIENEFGEIGIDNELVVHADEEIFEMNNGCICCTVRGDLIRILENLVKRRNKFDAVLIETTGLADPAPVAQTFFMDDSLKQSFRLDAIVTLVDAFHINQQLQTSQECPEQIGFADVILLNKIDLVPSDQLNTLEARIRSINRVAPIHRTSNAHIPLEKILNIRAFDLDNKLAFHPDFLEPELPFEWMGVFPLAEQCTLHLDPGPDPSMRIAVLPASDHSPATLLALREQAVRLFSSTPVESSPDSTLHPDASLLQLALAPSPSKFVVHTPAPGLFAFFTQHRPDEFNMSWRDSTGTLRPVHQEIFAGAHEHDDSVSSVGITDQRAVDVDKLNAWLSTLLREKGADIYRMKGIIHLSGMDNRFVFQGVHMLFDGKMDRPWRNDSERGNQLVFIGKNLDRQDLVSGFRSCLIPSQINTTA